MARDLDGSTGGLIAASAAVSLNAGTFMGWFRPQNASSSAVEGYFFDTDTARHAFYIRTISNQIEMYNDGRFTDFSVSFSANTWHHFAFVYNKTGNVQTAYMDGSALSVAVAGSGTWGSSSLGTNFYCGRRISASFFSGDVAEVATYSVNLTASEIASAAAGYSPLLIRPQSINSYWPVYGASSRSLIGLAGGHSRWGHGTAGQPSKPHHLPRPPEDHHPAAAAPNNFIFRPYRNLMGQASNASLLFDGHGVGRLARYGECAGFCVGSCSAFQQCRVGSPGSKLGFGVAFRPRECGNHLESSRHVCILKKCYNELWLIGPIMPWYLPSQYC